MTNEDIFEAFHKTLIDTGDNNNSFYVYNEDKTAVIIYTEADPSNINRLLIEREGGDRYIDIDKVKQAREEIHDLKKSDCPFNCGHNAIELAEEILDKLIAESEKK